MNNLWLTYAWKDNEDKDIDFIIQELDKTTLKVKFDRRNLIPGQRAFGHNLVGSLPIPKNATHGNCPDGKQPEKRSVHRRTLLRTRQGFKRQRRRLPHFRTSS